MNPQMNARGSSGSSGGNPFMSEENKMVPINLSKGSSNPFDSYRSKTNDMNSPQGLYDIAKQTGFGSQADDMIQRAGGESQQFMSGGFVMDVMDVLNIGSYGVVGMIKGKGFSEGVKNRESFSDDDSLGKYGIAGKISGFIADIIVDPFTYLAPWKLVAKVPGLVKTAEAVKLLAFGELEQIEVKGQKFFHREGGWTPLTFLSDKLIYGSAVDKSYLDGMQRAASGAETMLGQSDDLMTNILEKLKPDIFNKTLQHQADGRIGAKPFNELLREVGGKDAEVAKEMYDFKDMLTKKLVDLGVVSQQTSDEYFGTYLKQTYDEFLLAKKTKPGGKAGISLDTTSRKEGLTPEMMKELGQVEDAGVVWGQTLVKMIKQIKDAELQKYTSDGFAMTDDMIPEFLEKGGDVKNLYQVPNTNAYSQIGKKFELKSKIGKLNTELKNIKKERLKAGADLAEVESTIGKLTKELDRLKGATEEQLTEAWSGVRQLIKEAGIKPGPIKKAPTSLGQRAVAAPLEKWLKRGTKSDRLARETISSADLWKQFQDTKDGFAIQRAFDKPDLMYQWSNPIEFLDSIRYPNKSTIFNDNINRAVDLSDTEQLSRIKGAEKNAKKIGALTQEKLVLQDTTLDLVSNTVGKIEDDYADLLWQKSNLLEDLNKSKYGSLGGKYVSKEIWDVLKGSFEPTEEFGQRYVMWFKHAKVIWNPASQVRNAMSASIQNWWKMGMGPWRMDIYYDALREFKMNGGKGGPLITEMRKMGFHERSGQIQELVDNYLLNKDLTGMTYIKQLGGVKQARKFGRHIDKMLTNSYGHIDNVAKVAAYKYAKKQGLSNEEAFGKAMAATFNYSEVTPFVQRMRKSLFGVPFITFGLKALPLVAETLVKSPNRISVFGKIRNDLFKAAGVEGEQEAEAMPAWMRDDSFMMRLPWKDGEGRAMYFDMSYIIPFGNLADGSALKDPLSLNPALNLVRELSKNETFSGSKVFKESDDMATVLADISAHILKMGLPPPVTDFMSDGYASDGKRMEPKMGWGDLAGTNVDDLGPGERSFYQKTFKQLGFTATPYELNSKESALAYKQKENLSKLLTENGITKMYESTYLPKDSELRPENQQFTAPSISDRDVKPIGR